MDDRELLGRYAQEQDQQAFAELVGRHGPWVYAAAKRQVRDAHAAEDVTQAVFLLLSRRAGKLVGYGYLGGWLFRALSYCVREVVRDRARRSKREEEAARMRGEMDRPAAGWEEIAPELEAAVGRLGRADREAVLLRFYEQKPLAEVGRALGVSEDTARKRVERAVGRLRERLAARGVGLEKGSLAGMLSVHAGSGGPAALVGKVMGAMGSGRANGVAEGIAKGAAKMMVGTKVPVLVIGAAVVGGVVVTVMAGAGATPAGTPAKMDAPATQLPAAAGTDGAAFAEESDVTVLWARGKKEIALARFASIQWASYRPPDRLSVFTITEKEYVSLPEPDQRVVDGRVQSLKELARYALDQGDAAATRGDAEAAQKHYIAVRDCGAHFVSDEQTLAVLKLVGRALQDKVRPKLK